MATKRLPMRQIREILRLKHDQQLSHRAIASACRVGLGTVADYLGRAKQAGLEWPLPEDRDEAALEARLFPRAGPGSRERVEFFGGSSRIWVPDQLKSAITQPCRYEAGVNRTYQDEAEHYGAVVIPARPRKARDKAKVESTVLVAQRWILARIRNRTFFSLADLNGAIRELLVELNQRPMQKLRVSRLELYERLDRPALQPLPTNRYEQAEWKDCRGSIDYHITVDRHPYSVPYQLIHERVEARYTASIVEVYYKGLRVTSHRRRYDHKPSTLSEHMPSAHRAHAEWTPSRLISWAEKTGPKTRRLVEEIMKRWPHPEQGYRACLGLMSLGRRSGAERLEAASARALHLQSYSYRTVKNILSSAQDRLPFGDTETPPTPHHDNIRGAAYYADAEETHSC